MAASVTITPQLLSGLTNVAYGAQLLGLGPKQLGKSSFGESFETSNAHACTMGFHSAARIGLGAAFFALDKLNKSSKETRELNVLTAVGGLVDAGACPPPGERSSELITRLCMDHRAPSIDIPLNAPPALAQFSKSEYGMDETQANIATVLSGGIGLFAAVKAAEGYGAFGESKSAGV